MEDNALSNKRERNTHVNERLHTSFANSGRIAGDGIIYDDYGDESGYRPGLADRGRVRFPSDYLTDKQIAALSGEVRVYKASKA